MLAKLSSYTLIGIDAAPVEVEVDVSTTSMPKTVLVGLAEAAVRESTHRVERALVDSGYQRPFDRVIINRAPASLNTTPRIKNGIGVRHRVFLSCAARLSETVGPMTRTAVN